MLTVVFVYGLIQYAKPDYLVDDDGNNVTIFGFGAVAVVGIGALVLGVILMFVWWAMSPGFFKGKTLPAPCGSGARTGDRVASHTSDCRTPATCRRSSRPTCRTCRQARRPSIPSTGEEFTRQRG